MKLFQFTNSHVFKSGGREGGRKGREGGERESGSREREGERRREGEGDIMIMCKKTRQ